MRPGRIVALVIGCLLVIPAAALLLGGGTLGAGYAFARGDDGYFDATLERLDTNTVAITADDITFAAEPGSPDWVLDAIDADVRIRASSASGERDVFLGIARQDDVDRYLAGIAHVEIVDVDEDLEAEYRLTSGSDQVEPPIDQDFWAVSATGPGTQELEWEATTGRWTAVLMNADGSPGVSADVNVGVTAEILLPLALIMLGMGALVIAAAVVLIVAGARGAAGQASVTPPPAPTIVPAASSAAPAAAPTSRSPLALNAQLDPGLSRWQWLVKWILAIPHFVVLLFLWLAFVVLTFVAAVAIVFTGRFPEGIFEFNVGVLRWSWRVSYYATAGGIGTDRYPPFSLRAEPDDLAHLDVVYPERLSRGLVLVKWFLAIPHLVIVALLTGFSLWWFADGVGPVSDTVFGGGLLAVLVLIAGVALLFTGRYPPSLFDLIVGCNRWVYRTIAYLALMTDDYPPFRLDQGGAEPSPEPLPPPPTTPASIDEHAPANGSEPVGV